MVEMLHISFYILINGKSVDFPPLIKNSKFKIHNSLDFLIQKVLQRIAAFAGLVSFVGVGAGYIAVKGGFYYLYIIKRLFQ